MANQNELLVAPVVKLLPLTRKRARFVELYPKCKYNASEAARQAGYAEKSIRVTACMLLTFANVKAAIEAQERLFAAASDWTFEKAKQAAFDLLETVKADQDWTNAARIQEMLNKMHGYLKDYKPLAPVSVNLNVELSSIPTPDLKKAVLAELSEVSDNRTN